MSVVRINAITVPAERAEELLGRLSGQAFQQGHAQHATGRPVSTGSELWSSDVVQHEEA